MGSEVCSRLKFLGANGDVVKSRRPPFGVGKKARPMGARLAQARKSKANPLPAPLLQPLAPALAAAFVGAVVGGGVLVAKVFCFGCKWWCGEKWQHKSAANGHETGAP